MSFDEVFFERESHFPYFFIEKGLKMRPMKKKTLLLHSSLVLLTLLSSCSSSGELEPKPGGGESKMTGISSYLYEKKEDGELIGMTQCNSPDCSGEERFVNLFVPLLNKDYYILIYPVLSESSKSLMLVGDQAKVAENEAYTVSFYEEMDQTAYKISFGKVGRYRVNITLGSFSDCFDVVTEEESSSLHQ